MNTFGLTDLHIATTSASGTVTVVVTHGPTGTVTTATARLDPTLAPAEQYGAARRAAKHAAYTDMAERLGRGHGSD